MTHSSAAASDDAFFGDQPKLVLRCVQGPQAGQTIVAPGDKSVLRFQFGADTADDECLLLVILGTAQTAFRVIQGNIRVNNQLAREGWLNVGDQIECGSSAMQVVELRLPTDTPTSDPAPAIEQTVEQVDAAEPVASNALAVAKPSEQADDISGTMLLNPDVVSSARRNAVYVDHEEVEFYRPPQSNDDPTIEDTENEVVEQPIAANDAEKIVPAVVELPNVESTSAETLEDDANECDVVSVPAFSSADDCPQQEMPLNEIDAAELGDLADNSTDATALVDSESGTPLTSADCDTSPIPDVGTTVELPSAAFVPKETTVTNPIESIAVPTQTFSVAAGDSPQLEMPQLEMPLTEIDAAELGDHADHSVDATALIDAASETPSTSDDCDTSQLPDFAAADPFEILTGGPPSLDQLPGSIEIGAAAGEWLDVQNSLLPLLVAPPVCGVDYDWATTT